MAGEENSGGEGGEGTTNEGGDQGAGDQTGKDQGGAKGTDAGGQQDKGAKGSKGSGSEQDKTKGGSTDKTQQKQDGDQKKGESKASGKGANDGAPAEVELKLPTGVVADPDMLGGLKELVKAGDLSGEAAQKAVDLYTKSYQKSQTQSLERFNQEQVDWAKAIEDDKEMGGNPEKLQVTRANVDKAMTRFGSPSFNEWAKKTGFGNHPEMVRTFAKIGAAMKEDSIGGSTTPPSGTGAAKSESEKAAARYPNM
jgi:hypothetical protein